MYVTRERDELYGALISGRLMMQAGWLEGAQLPQQWKKFIKIKKIIGYDDILEYHEKMITYPQLIERIQQRTRNYAKRQNTYFDLLIRSISACELDVHVVEVNLTLLPVDLYLNQLINTIIRHHEKNNR